jgi:hypothetical protein
MLAVYGCTLPICTTPIEVIVVIVVPDSSVTVIIRSLTPEIPPS